MCGHVRRVPYIVSLLRKGLAVPESRIRIGGGNEGWTLGAALAEGGRVGIGRPLIDKVIISLHGNVALRDMLQPYRSGLDTAGCSHRS